MFAIPDGDILKQGQQQLDRMMQAKKPAGPHQERIDVFNDTKAWIRSDTALSEAVLNAQLKTSLFYENDYPAFQRPERDQRITVTKHRSYEAAMLLHKQNPGAKIAVMNFANAFNPGGGVTTGASAQEECLCRCSTLYPVLNTPTLQERFYQYHKDLNTAKASDSIVYSEGIIICKTDTDLPQRMPEEDWVSVDVMTIAAPDLRTNSNQHVALVGNGTFMNNAELFGCHVKRAIHLLTVAAAKGADCLVLGAFGCGAFKNDPHVVARAYKVALQEFPKVFREIEFAIYCGAMASPNYVAFHDELIGEEET